MAVIPFGLIGTVLGHDHFNLALSLFTLIGLIGMSGIIINDAIVLVTTLDQLREKLSAAEAAVEAAKSRIRPIMLTTLTTVLGLAPLMYESSRQALFLKPTVVTLVYGLSIGFFIVLLMLPALVVIQDDFAKAWSSFKEAVSGENRDSQLRNLFRAGTIAIVLINLVLLGNFTFKGEPLGLVQTLSGLFPQLSTGFFALLLSVLLSGIVALIVALLSRQQRTPS